MIREADGSLTSKGRQELTWQPKDYPDIYVSELTQSKAEWFEFILGRQALRF